MENFDSIRRNFIADKVEAEIDVLQEERYREETVEELSWRVVFDDLHPDLLLLTVGALNKVV